MKTRDDLLEAIGRGDAVDYFFFWGHRPSPTGEVTKSCLSQWYESPFVEGDVTYRTAEHFMMARKAELFGDLAARDAILRAEDPGKAKSLGRKVTGFHNDIWESNRLGIVVKGNLLKFGQNPRLGKFLLHTGNSVLVEASPLDTIWGIGLGANSDAARDPSRWRGLNLLGFALMEVRSKVRDAG